MRGVSGSGKSTRAGELAGPYGKIHSTDSYFYKKGKYCFDPKRLAEYHHLNFEAFRRSLEKGVTVVICDNTNIRHRDYRHYIGAAQKAGYDWFIVEMSEPSPILAAVRNIHGVPQKIIERMMSNWEPLDIPTELCHRA